MVKTKREHGVFCMILGINIVSAPDKCQFGIIAASQRVKIRCKFYYFFYDRHF
jgi:hypothetical protein